jgi:putative DNA primase/helicase
MTDPLEQFRAAIEDAGLEAPDFIKPDGKLHRFASDGRRSDRAGWYVFYPADVPAGAFGCWRRGVSETWRAELDRKLTKREIAAHKRQMEDARRRREAEERKNRTNARKKAAVCERSERSPILGEEIRRGAWAQSRLRSACRPTARLGGRPA